MKLTSKTAAALDPAAGQVGGDRLRRRHSGLRSAAAGRRRRELDLPVSRRRQAAAHDARVWSAPSRRPARARSPANCMPRSSSGRTRRSKAEERVRAVETLGATLDAYLAYQRTRLKPSSLIEVTRHLRKHCRPLHGLRLDKIDRRAVAARITTLAAKSGAVASNRVAASLRAFFNWAIREGLASSNPAAGLNRQPERSRARVLDDSELKAIWAATADASDYSAVVRLLMLSGQRAAEIAGLRWSEIAGDQIVLPPERTKNSRAACRSHHRRHARHPRRTPAPSRPRPDLRAPLGCAIARLWACSRRRSMRASARRWRLDAPRSATHLRHAPRRARHSAAHHFRHPEPRLRFPRRRARHL